MRIPNSDLSYHKSEVVTSLEMETSEESVDEINLGSLSSASVRRAYQRVVHQSLQGSISSVLSETAFADKCNRMMAIMLNDTKRFELRVRKESVIDMKSFSTQYVVERCRWAANIDNESYEHDGDENCKGNRLEPPERNDNKRDRDNRHDNIPKYTPLLMEVLGTIPSKEYRIVYGLRLFFTLNIILPRESPRSSL